jgi:hypothetical protein
VSPYVTLVLILPGASGGASMRRVSAPASRAAAPNAAVLKKTELRLALGLTFGRS